MDGLTVKEEMKLRAQLYRKIEEVANGIGALQKTGQNKFSNYKYITHEQVTTALRPLLLKFGLSIMMEIVNREEDNFKSDKGKLTTRSIVTALFTLVDTETGYFIEKTFPGAEQDNGGKSLQQAITQAQKYFLFKTFKVTDKDSDGDQKTTSINTGAASSGKRPTTPKKQTTQKPTAPAKPPTLTKIKKDLQSIHSPEGVKEYYLSLGGSNSGIKRLREEVVKRGEAIKKQMAAEAEAEAEEKASADNGVKSWSVDGSNGEKYKVTQSAQSGWGCTCKAFQTRQKGQLCKHVEFVIDKIANHAKQN